MTLYIRQKLFTFGDKYNIYDANENIIYSAFGEVFTFGNKIHMCDAHGDEIFFIKQKMMTFLPKYEIYKGDNLFATLNKEFTFFCKKIDVDSPLGYFVIDGNFFDHEYSISFNGKLVGTVQKEWLTWGDVYALNINNVEYKEFFVALVLTIDCILEQGRNN